MKRLRLIVENYKHKIFLTEYFRYDETKQLDTLKEEFTDFFITVMEQVAILCPDESNIYCKVIPTTNFTKPLYSLLEDEAQQFRELDSS